MHPDNPSLQRTLTRQAEATRGLRVQALTVQGMAIQGAAASPGRSEPAGDVSFANPGASAENKSSNVSSLPQAVHSPVKKAAQVNVNPARAGFELHSRLGVILESILHSTALPLQSTTLPLPRDSNSGRAGQDVEELCCDEAEAERSREPQGEDLCSSTAESRLLELFKQLGQQKQEQLMEILTIELTSPGMIQGVLHSTLDASASETQVDTVGTAVVREGRVQGLGKAASARKNRVDTSDSADILESKRTRQKICTKCHQAHSAFSSCKEAWTNDLDDHALHADPDRKLADAAPALVAHDSPGCVKEPASRDGVVSKPQSAAEDAHAWDEALRGRLVSLRFGCDKKGEFIRKGWVNGYDKNKGYMIVCFEGGRWLHTMSLAGNDWVSNLDAAAEARWAFLPPPESGKEMVGPKDGVQYPKGTWLLVKFPGWSNKRGLGDWHMCWLLDYNENCTQPEQNGWGVVSFEEGLPSGEGPYVIPEIPAPGEANAFCRMIADGEYGFQDAKDRALPRRATPEKKARRPKS